MLLLPFQLPVKYNKILNYHFYYITYLVSIKTTLLSHICSMFLILIFNQLQLFSLEKLSRILSLSISLFLLTIKTGNSIYLYRIAFFLIHINYAYPFFPSLVINFIPLSPLFNSFFLKTLKNYLLPACVCDLTFPATFGFLVL